MQDVKYINSAAVCNRLGGITRATLNRWQKRDINPFPAPSIAGVGFQNRWEISRIEEWEEAQNSPTIDSSAGSQAV